MAIQYFPLLSFTRPLTLYHWVEEAPGGPVWSQRSLIIVSVIMAAHVRHHH